MCAQVEVACWSCLQSGGAAGFRRGLEDRGTDWSLMVGDPAVGGGIRIYTFPIGMGGFDFGDAPTEVFWPWGLPEARPELCPSVVEASGAQRGQLCLKAASQILAPQMSCPELGALFAHPEKGLSHWMF